MNCSDCNSPAAPHELIGGLRPAMFLQRRFSRPARYEVVGVKCERVNEISGADIRAEGMTQDEYEKAPGDLAWYRDLWNSIHAAHGTRFDAWPFVCAYEFRRVL